MDDMRVALVGPYPASEGSVFGGVEAATSSLADGLAALDEVEVHAVTAVPGLRSYTHKVTSPGVHVHLLPLFRKLGCLTAFAIDRGRIRSKLREINPDIIHIHTQLMYGYSALERGWPSVLTPHGIYHRETASKRGMDRLQSQLGCRYEADSVRRARHIIAINRYSIREYGSYVRTNDIRYIDNSIKDHWFNVADHAEPCRILFGGFIYDLKNLLYLLEAVAELADSHPTIRLRVAGSVREQDYYDRCLKLVADRGIEKNVDFLGPLSVEGMVEEHSKASLVALTSKQENAPIIISEAMAAAKPVVGTDIGGIAEMVADGESGYVVPLDDVKTLADRIHRLLSDDDLRKRMGQAGKAIAEQRFKRSVVASKTLDFYREIIENERGHHI